MLLVVFAIAASWAVLLGVAYAARVILRCSPYRSALLVGVAYLACAGSAFAWLGLSSAGVLGAFGHSLPAAGALLLVFIHPASDGPPR